ncbi:MAG: tRNA (adenosine(37)-N6)-threonylcarbamoyltransferase complex ATPase subunit type 1 TsaE [Bacteroidaceae bacterium]|nr:tRNA (adenosine(37)-N6)-threonylcarbamoyltransferase complex ATPase subunit type 1 TsaE [Bacteroidaceae bacterium]
MRFTIEHIDDAAGKFLEALGERKIVAFYGGMGAGKTTFIKAVCNQLGVADVITSPTFAIVNEYADLSGNPIYHFDFYRIKKVDEVRDLSFDDYIYSGDLCLMEWPELIEELLPPETVRVTIRETDGGERELSMEGCSKNSPNK